MRNRVYDRLESGPRSELGDFHPAGNVSSCHPGIPTGELDCLSDLSVEGTDNRRCIVLLGLAHDSAPVSDGLNHRARDVPVRSLGGDENAGDRSPCHTRVVIAEETELRQSRVGGLDRTRTQEPVEQSSIQHAATRVGHRHLVRSEHARTPSMQHEALHRLCRHFPLRTTPPN